MNRATFTVGTLRRPANTYASLPPAMYVPRTGTVADLEAQLAHDAEVAKTRAFLAAKRLQASKTLNKVLAAALVVMTVGMIAAISAAVI